MPLVAMEPNWSLSNMAQGFWQNLTWLVQLIVPRPNATQATETKFDFTKLNHSDLKKRSSLQPAIQQQLNPEYPLNSSFAKQLIDLTTATLSGPTTVTVYGDTNSINSLAVSPDGTMLASGSDDIMLWNTKNNMLITTLSGHNECVFSVAFSPDGTQLASASSDHTIKLWDIKIGHSSLPYLVILIS